MNFYEELKNDFPELLDSSIRVFTEENGMEIPEKIELLFYKEPTENFYFGEDIDTKNMVVMVCGISLNDEEHEYNLVIPYHKDDEKSQFIPLTTFMNLNNPELIEKALKLLKE